MITCTRRIQFCAGHRVFQHGSKCRHLHGHNYVALIKAQIPDPNEDSLNELGMVIDFSVLKEKIGGWIDEHWDHGFIYFVKDDAVFSILNLFEDLEDEHGDFAQKKYALPANPTAENMALHLLRISNQLLADTKVRVIEVTLWETENCYATVTETELAFLPPLDAPETTHETSPTASS